MIETLAFRYGSQSYRILEKSKLEEEFYILQNGEKFYESEVKFITNREDIRFATDFSFVDLEWVCQVYWKNKK